MVYRKIISVITAFSLILMSAGCSKTAQEAEQPAEPGTITLLNIKSEVGSQIGDLAKEYSKESGVSVNVINVPAGVDAQATLKGYYLSDQMPDIIACEASGFSNWDGLLEDLSDQDWVQRTDASYSDSTYGVLGFPYTTEAIGLAYNANILSSCGIDPASITGPESLQSAFETIDSKKNELGLTAVIGFCAEPNDVGWSAGNHIFGTYLDSGLGRTDTTYIDMLNDGGKIDDERFSAFANMISLFIKYSDPAVLTESAYNEQVANFAAGKYAFVTQGSWIGATMTGDSSADYAAAGNFEVGMLPYCFLDGQDTILTSAPSWWAIPKEGNVEEAKAFLQWCSEDSGQKILVESAGFISPFTDCKYVASDPFAKVISSYISAGKTSNWHWQNMPSGLGQNGLSFAFYKFATGELDPEGFINEVKSITSEWYSKL
ncbi:raffinose/stachyose/melibiose transport system substrate-binding protein [Butyrivibrio sp. ob235]|uniref:ABC transporter substrate-binding protein n=1 Tax=Butyrivibrio sp. ob235 TaxID=1761780 RepID=UPI0008D19102|nr:extracellular solute-binding protein [Butyrivibrio sp. ob235]SEM05032.1 raffinose/stachyose/melibiose transport system substrate-binding protein [Butyrivibrio sp. ob235]